MADIKVDKLETTSPNFEMLTSDDITLAANYSAGVSGTQMFMDGSLGNISLRAETSQGETSILMTGDINLLPADDASIKAPGFIQFESNYSAGVSGSRIYMDGTAETIDFYTGGSVNWQINSLGQFVFNGNQGVMVAGTTDGSDNKALRLCGGGDVTGWTRGAQLLLCGNEFVNPGLAILSCGDVAGAKLHLSTVGSQPIEFSTINTLRWTIGTNGNFTSSNARIYSTNNADEITIGYANNSDGGRIRVFGVNDPTFPGRIRFESPSASVAQEHYGDLVTWRRYSDSFTYATIRATDGSEHFIVDVPTSSNGRATRANVRNTSYAETMHYSTCSTAASSSWSFATYRSSGTSDTEFWLRGDGNAFADGSWNGGGADYAEYFESTDSTAIPVGTTVVLVNDKVRAYDSNTDTPADIMGVVRPKTGGSCLIGNLPLKWHQKYLRDEYGAYILDVNGERQLNPSYDEQLEYISREGRDEWNLIGLLGQVAITKGQTVHPDWKLMNSAGSVADIYFVK